ncbi:hypothetical protein ALQ33_03451 [Pseudomonas syringae pv. philadelphi]|uniref:Uncharacterized protein n=1 Tax=Pseudomonas syringae pv. philadelphi TaxID=251706 RepID=A0A3M3Z788_9PSED|nr:MULTISPECIES: hypothetical protein [Pseudomonas syringae group]RMO89804.1 hypothetical protein ALQ33_03451 [Pseudomonas syringae pv. philadelphi]SDW60810.1 hypothetical protein SAMN05444514_10567 [Pseudomonas syringae]SFL84458.1 hypothetical protein SAMN05444064_10567 [Pseudomonas syringae]
MSDSANVIDFNLYRKRRQARATAELMWAMYVARASVTSFTFAVASTSSETRQA